MPLIATPRLITLILAASCLLRPLAAQEQPSAPGKSAPLHAGKAPKRVYRTVRLEGPPPKIDGRLDDACWSQGEWADDFIQREPHEGRSGSQPTQLKILYDDKYIYAAIRAYDSEVAALPRLRGQRDEIPGDAVGVTFDSYFDRRTCFEFDVSSGGSKIDAVCKDDVWDISWDAVWDVKIGTEADAWTAEFRIPLSQLRYSRQPEQVWGLHCWRWINRFQEESDWQFIPMDNPGFVYSFGELHGIRDLPPSRRIELLPYVLAKYATSAREAGNPYRRGAETDFEAGLDAKLGLASNFTLDLTVNPDFGQVEADPSLVNLTTYETFFEEKRPFFLEGKAIFESGLGDDLLFYSRRIGHAPAFDPPTGGFKKIPTATRILGAAKLTGKTPEGLSIGVLESITDREVARLTENGMEREQTVEPMTSYTVVRVQQDIDKGRTLVGGIVSATRRNLTDDTEDLFTRNAYTGGLDFLHYWSDRTYYVDLRALASRVAGSPAAIRLLQENPVHNYQRPDASHLSVDPAARHLDGTGGQLKVGKGSNGNWRYYGSVDWRSPGLELNDLGYLMTADLIRQSALVQYVDTQPAGFHRKYDVSLTQTNLFDFDGTPLQNKLQLIGNLMTVGNWNFWGEADYDSDLLDTRVLRGGPALRTPGGARLWIGGQTNSSKQQLFRLECGRTISLDGHSHYTEIAPSFSARLLEHANLQTKLSYSRDVEDFQYAGTAAAADGNRYAMGRMDQQTLAATVRLDLNLTPELSLTYYGSPFVSTGRFTDFKLVTQPRAARYGDRFRRLEAAATYDPSGNCYQVDDPGGAFSFADPDFSWRELRSNLVLRWEYRAGSTLYAVWTQNRASSAFYGDFSAGSEYRRLFEAHPDNTFLVKFSYWFSI
ncbi:MAG: DUF5916 domain-containing protein [Opitutaceae bacterium]|nr:DUF5916 domain-containing protein [Opitutaceae bacterium]